ncbi:hypothetical protein [Rathayibacter rathayi]|nr:hypothetical protein [Rathayibacter rathayi]
MTDLDRIAVGDPRAGQAAYRQRETDTSHTLTGTNEAGPGKPEPA